MLSEALDALRPGRSAGLASPEPIAVPVSGQLGHLHQSHLPGRAHPERNIGEAHTEGPQRGLPAQVRRLQQLGRLSTVFAATVTGAGHLRGGRSVVRRRWRR